MRLAAALALVAVAARPARAQERGVFERLGLDRLQFTGLGLSLGRIDPAQVEATSVYAIAADYGTIGPNWRLVFGTSYWESRMSDDAVRRFVDSLATSIDDPTGDATLRASRITMYDVTFSGGVRWTPVVRWGVQPYAAFGAAAHVMNAEGKLINGTFVERALDNIEAGFWASGGVELRPHPRFAVDAHARADLLSGFRSAQISVGAMYYLGPVRRVRQ